MSNTQINELEVNGVTYIRKDSIKNNTQATDTNGLPYVIIRSHESGCHAGFMESRDGNEVTLVNSRRLWYWSGAATLSQLAAEGVKEPLKCKFVDSPRITVLGICEIIEGSELARKSIEGVTAWKK